MNVPCKGCTKRHATCHAECYEYKAYRADVEEVKKARDVDRTYYSAESERKSACRRRREGFRPT